MARVRSCTICGGLGHNARTCRHKKPKEKTADIEWVDKPQRTSRRQKFCIECTSVHRHNDGAIFCSRFAARVKTDSLKPSSCTAYKRRSGPMQKVSARRGDGSELEQEMDKW